SLVGGKGVLLPLYSIHVARPYRSATVLNQSSHLKRSPFWRSRCRAIRDRLCRSISTAGIIALLHSRTEYAAGSGKAEVCRCVCQLAAVVSASAIGRRAGTMSCESSATFLTERSGTG